MAINLSIFIGNPAAVLGSFNRLRVERSTDGVDGPYTEITAPSATAASLLAANGGSLALVGLTLELKIDNAAPVEVTFTGTNPLTPAQIVTQINTAFPSDIATEVATKVQLTSPLTGTGSRVLVVGGSALVLLGFTEDQLDIGEDAYIELLIDEDTYPYTDEAGQGGNIYRTWFYDTVSGLESPRSDPFEGVPGTQVSAGVLSLATINLVDLSGRALANRKISLYPVSVPLTIEGFGVDLGRTGVTMVTDNSGHAEVQLVRGSIVKVVFEGTSFIRTVKVPDETEFDLLEAVSLEPDQFTMAVVPNLPAAPRRIL